MVKLEKISLRAAQRVIAISDVHGNLAYLRGLMNKLHLRSTDTLLFLGDLLEKGPDSLGVLRECMALREKCRVYFLQGNTDAWHLQPQLTAQQREYWHRNYFRRLQSGGEPGFLVQLCRACGISEGSGCDPDYLIDVLDEARVPEREFLRSLPQIIESEDYTFVHGGLPKEGARLSAAEPWDCMKYDSFAASGRKFDKWVICGHTPVMLYRRDITCANPIIDENTHIVSIDGGCVLKDDGQLNALILENGRFSFEYYDPFPVCMALDAQAESESSFYIAWGDNRVELLSEKNGVCRIRHLRTGREMDVPADFLSLRDGELITNDCTDYRPAIVPGELVSLVRQTECGAWIKKNGVSGWYDGCLQFVE